jgi:hypothetical protein
MAHDVCGFWFKESVLALVKHSVFNYYSCLLKLTVVGDFFRQLWGPYAGWAQTVSSTKKLSTDEFIPLKIMTISMLIVLG